MQDTRDLGATDERGHGVLGVMWRHRLLVLATVVVALGAGVALALLQPEVHAASAQVFMSDPRAEGVFRVDPAGDDTRRQQNRVDRFRSEAVLTRAAEMVGSSMQLGELRSAVEVVPAAVADEITVTARADDPAQARDLANAVVAAYREQFRAEAIADAERTVEVLDDELAALEQQLDETEAELAQYLQPAEPGGPVVRTDEPLPSPGYVTLLTARRDAQVSMVRDLLVTREQTLIEARATEDVARVEAATGPAVTTPDPVLTISLAAVVGLVAGALLAVWRDERKHAPARHTRPEAETQRNAHPAMVPPGSSRP